VVADHLVERGALDLAALVGVERGTAGRLEGSALVVAADGSPGMQRDVADREPGLRAAKKC